MEEMPSWIEGFNIDFDEPTQNKKMFDYYTNSKYCKHIKDNLYYFNPPENELQSCFSINPTLKKLDLVYVWQYGTLYQRTKKFPVIMEVVSWKNKKNPNHMNEIIWKYVFINRNLLACDREHSKDGGKLWKRLISDAFNNNCNVYLYDFRTETFQTVKNTKESIDLLYKVGYGIGDWFKSKRIVIEKL